jgi:hypothetical protein
MRPASLNENGPALGAQAGEKNSGNRKIRRLSKVPSGTQTPFSCLKQTLKLSVKRLQCKPATYFFVITALISSSMFGRVKLLV